MLALGVCPAITLQKTRQKRTAGHPTHTERVMLTDEDGVTHSGVALYYLRRPNDQAALTPPD